MNREFSAGGIVSRDDKLLLVRVRNLKGEKVWTFPKGHVDKGETPLQAALREVEEETGWRCRKLKSLFTARYLFKRKGGLVSKRVQWYWCQPLEKTGKPDADEILSARWVPRSEAPGLLSYPSDFKLLELWAKESASSGSSESASSAVKSSQR